MLYYRRKILLALLEMFNGHLTAIQIQKYLFLLTRLQANKTYYFVPYRYGCFSFQANQDLTTLSTYGYVKLDDNSCTLVDTKQSYFAQLNLFDQQYMHEIYKSYSAMSQDELIAYTYIHYPYYAINSTIANQLLTQEQIDKINLQKPHKTQQQLFTIGYEGVSLEEYINKLLLADIPLLCDVRKNAYSQKYGFSKSQLQKACEGVGIRYVHVSNLGIESNKRQELKTQRDYDILFDDYERTTLKENTESIKYVSSLLMHYKRIALTCFEKNPAQCHRSHVANAIVQYTNRQYPLTNIMF